MSNFNFNWLKENFQNKKVTIFDIGCASMFDTLKMKELLPDASVYAFECANVWLESNLIKAEQNNIKYFHLAISDTNGIETFYPSSVFEGREWPWSGSLCSPGENLKNEKWLWGKGYTVETITLDAFCSMHQVEPDFIHIDVQGAEYKVFSCLGNIRPKCIWAEVSEFHNYETGTDYDTFYNLMMQFGYQQVYIDHWDALYVHNNASLSKY